MGSHYLGVRVRARPRTVLSALLLRTSIRGYWWRHEPLTLRLLVGPDESVVCDSGSKKGAAWFWRFQTLNQSLLDIYWATNEKLIGFGTGAGRPIDCRIVFRLEPNS